MYRPTALTGTPRTELLRAGVLRTRTAGNCAVRPQYAKASVDRNAGAADAFLNRGLATAIAWLGHRGGRVGGSRADPPAAAVWLPR